MKAVMKLRFLGSLLGGGGNASVAGAEILSKARDRVMAKSLNHAELKALPLANYHEQNAHHVSHSFRPTRGEGIPIRPHFRERQKLDIDDSALQNIVQEASIEEKKREEEALPEPLRRRIQHERALMEAFDIDKNDSGAAIEKEAPEDSILVDLAIMNDHEVTKPGPTSNEIAKKGKPRKIDAPITTTRALLADS